MERTGAGLSAGCGGQWRRVFRCGFGRCRRNEGEIAGEHNDEVEHVPAIGKVAPGLPTLRGHLEQIDFAAFAANREVVAKTLGHADLEQFQRLAVVAANARASWLGASMALSNAKPLMNSIPLPTPALLAAPDLIMPLLLIVAGVLVALRLKMPPNQSLEPTRVGRPPLAAQLQR